VPGAVPRTRTEPVERQHERHEQRRPRLDVLPAVWRQTAAIPRKGHPGQARRTHEHKPTFRSLVKWRAGGEGRISRLKHRYGLARSLTDGRTPAATWCGHGIFTHNLVKITTLPTDSHSGPNPTAKHHDHATG
jgi:IS5 family transposase